ncbi:MAG: AAA family ATPase [Planctomycetota bacterium]|nr:AAA family ATPase [Planctomycetota bacterium]
MSTTAPTLAPPTPSNAPPPRLWPAGFEIPILAVTGEPAAGKTLFGLQVAGARTKVLDFELGSATYEKSMGFDRTDVPAELAKLFQNGNFQPIHAFLWFRKFCESIAPGQYDALVIDDISQIEDGCTEWVRKNPGYFGKTQNQFATSEPQVWGCMKVLYKQILCALAPKVQTVCLISHMRDEFKGGKPTGRREPKGKDTILELATLYLELRRFPDQKGIVPAKPIARIIKSRLTHAVMNPTTGDFDLSPVLTPVVEDCTPAKIRHLMLNPVNYEKLKPSERVQTEFMSEDEKLRAQQQIAADTARGQEAARDRAAMEREAAMARGMVLPPVNSDMSGEIAAAKVEKTAQSAMEPAPAAQGVGEVVDSAHAAPVAPAASEVPWNESADAPAAASDPASVPVVGQESAEPVAQSELAEPAEPQEGTITVTQKEHLAFLLSPEGLNIPFPKWQEIMMQNYGFNSARFLNEDQADILIAAMDKKLEAKKLKANEATWVSNVVQSEPSQATPAAHTAS